MSDAADRFDTKRDEYTNEILEGRVRLITKAIREMCKASFSAGANAALDSLTEDDE